MSTTDRQRLGRLGEDAVVRRYADMGFAVEARNLHLSHNEIDLILKSDTHLVFVEVKTRHAVPGARSRFGRPADAVNKVKRTRTVEAAKAYLREHPTPLQPRIDVAEVYVSRRVDGTDEVTEVLIFRNAFGAR
ncbi:MAG: YraN family protein [Clostridia bacterium]|nr:YraN family protein [Clostridia bacterium]